MELFNKCLEYTNYIISNWGIFGWITLVIISIPLLALIIVIIKKMITLFFISLDIIIKFIITLIIVGIFILMIGMVFDVSIVIDFLRGGM